MMTCGILDGLTDPATDLVQLGRREAFRVNFDGGNGGQCGTERLGAVVGRWSGISHGAVLRSGDGFSVQWTLLLDTSPGLRVR
jgi:hypothetical protein